MLKEFEGLLPNGVDMWKVWAISPDIKKKFIFEELKMDCVFGNLVQRALCGPPPRHYDGHTGKQVRDPGPSWAWPQSRFFDTSSPRKHPIDLPKLPPKPQPKPNPPKESFHPFHPQPFSTLSASASSTAQRCSKHRKLVNKELVLHIHRRLQAETPPTPQRCPQQHVDSVNF